jgi:hypothetical protein
MILHVEHLFFLCIKQDRLPYFLKSKIIYITKKQPFWVALRLPGDVLLSQGESPNYHRRKEA